MAFLDFNSTEGAPLHTIGGSTAIAERTWLRPRREVVTSRWQRLVMPAAIAATAAAIPALVAGDYFDDPLLGWLAAAVLYAASAPAVAWFFGGQHPTGRAYHTKI